MTQKNMQYTLQTTTQKARATHWGHTAPKGQQLLKAYDTSTAVHIEELLHNLLTIWHKKNVHYIEHLIDKIIRHKKYM